MTCPKCNKEINYPKHSTYEDLWYSWDGPGHNIKIRCPHGACTLVTTIHEEPPRADRYVLTYGKYEGKRLSWIKKHDKDYLTWLKKGDEVDQLLLACLEKRA